MSADHDQGSRATDRTLSTGERTDEGSRVEARSQPRATGPGQRAKRVRTATVDRGGPPVENPSDAHRAVAARDRLWESYSGTDNDGCFVWAVPDEGEKE